MQTILFNPVVAQSGDVRVYLNTLTWPAMAFLGFLCWAARDERPLNAAVSRVLGACVLVGVLIFARSLVGGEHPHTVANLLRLAYVPMGVLAGLAVYRSINQLLNLAAVALGVKGAILVAGAAGGPIDVYHRIGPDGLGGPNIFGALLATVILLRASTWFLADDRPGLVVRAALVVCGLCVLLTFSRAAAVALAVGVVALGVMLLRARGKLAKAWLLLSVLVVPFVPGSPVQARLSGLSTAESSGRTAIWDPAWDGFMRSAGVGNGFGSFEATSESFGDLVNAGDVPVTYSAHNMPLQVLFETGLFGLIAVAAATALVLQRSWHRVLLPTTAALAVHSLFETMPYVVQTAWVYGLVLAVGLSYREARTTATDAPGLLRKEPAAAGR